MGTTIFFFFFFSKFKKFLKMAKKWGKKVEKSWETVQIKAFTHWVNTVLEQREMRIEDLSQDLSSGVELINFLELLSGKSLNKKYDKKPQMRIQKIQNVHLALKFLESEMDVKLVGIGAEDFAEQVDLLAEKLEAENTTLTKLLKQKKADDGKGDEGKTGKKADKSAKSSSSSSTTTKDSKKKSKK